MSGSDAAQPDAAQPGAAPLRGQPAERIAVTFARVLRGAGLATPIGNVLTYVDALGRVGLDDATAVYWAGRTTLVFAPEDIPLYDRAFRVFWGRISPGDLPPEPEVQRITLALDDEDAASDTPDDAERTADRDPTLVLRFSAAEVLRQKDFATYDDIELRQSQQLMEQLRFAGPPRRSFRNRPARNGSRPDIRRTMRESLRAGGEPIRRAWQEPGQRLRRLVLLLDISGSMEPYSRAMLRFVQAAVAGRQRVEAFALGTRLTRITKELDSRDPDRALGRAADRVQDWSGGTRLGECLRDFNDEWGARGMARGAIVVILSDGWDRGDPALLGEQMQRLHRITRELVWVNPLKVTPGYAPLARGMAAALPYVDHFVEGHSLAAMEELAAVIAGTTSARRRDHPASPHDTRSP
ncbi:MAG: putative carbon monoxide dehydrogenase accessory protein [Ilumatobacteraceae bacterium]|nr:putative carbon monoxide dehydrogenase accessory protein [Ilumatobacteraceae bacterium]